MEFIAETVRFCMSEQLPVIVCKFCGHRYVYAYVYVVVSNGRYETKLKHAMNSPYCPNCGCVPLWPEGNKREGER